MENFDRCSYSMDNREEEAMSSQYRTEQSIGTSKEREKELLKEIERVNFELMEVKSKYKELKKHTKCPVCLTEYLKDYITID